MIRILVLVAAIFASGPAAAETEPLTIDQVRIERAPIHGVELGMDVRKAAAILKEGGFTRESRGCAEKSACATFNMTINPNSANPQIIDVATFDSWQRGDVRVTLSWAGGNPFLDGAQIETPMPVFQVHRRERFEEFAALEPAIQQLNERFGFENWNCSRNVGGNPRTTMRIGVHVTETGQSSEELLPYIATLGQRCETTFHPVGMFEGPSARAFDSGNMLPETSFVLTVKRNRDNSLQELGFSLTAVRDAFEQGRTLVESAEAATEEVVPDTSGLSDF